MARHPFWFAIAAIGSFLAAHASAQSFETQPFDSAASATAAGWTGEDNNDPDLGTEFGFSPTNNAGGSPGEAGGLFPRIQTPVAFYGDTNLGGTLTLDDPLIATGKFTASNLGFDGEVFLGWFDVSDIPDRTDFMGFQLREPNGDTNPDFRQLATYQLASGTIDAGDFVALPGDIRMDFTIEYDPDGGAGSGMLTVTMTPAGGQPISISNELSDADRQEDAEFNAFGLTTSGGAGSNVPEQQVEIFIDDLRYTSAKVSLLGDFNGDGSLNVSDIDALTAQIDAGGTDVRFDVNGDQAINQADRRVWIKDLRKTWFGDANLDGEFNSGDFVHVFQIGEYEDVIARNSTWADGDWNGDLEFNSGDFVTAFQDGGFEKGPLAVVVPEPSGLLIVALGVWMIARDRSIELAKRCEV
jgi:hypothetical protein